MAALNALYPPALAWSEHRATLDMLDLCGHPIKAGERYFRREVLYGAWVRKEYECLALPSMAQHLLMSFGANAGLLSNCKHAALKREDEKVAELSAAQERVERMFSSGQT